LNHLGVLISSKLIMCSGLPHCHMFEDNFSNLYCPTSWHFWNESKTTLSLGVGRMHILIALPVSNYPPITLHLPSAYTTHKIIRFCWMNNIEIIRLPFKKIYPSVLNSTTKDFSTGKWMTRCSIESKKVGKNILSNTYIGWLLFFLSFELHHACSMY